MNLPQKKVFVDGRMPSWKWEPDNTNDLSNAFETYNGILAGTVDYKKVFNDFGVDTVLSQKYSEIPKESIYKYAENLLAAFGWEGVDFSFLDTLEEDGWKIVYEDDISVIYRHDTPKPH